MIQKTIEIKASPDKVWRVFTDPSVSRQLGGEYISDWQIGSSFGWKSTDGKVHTKGTILEIVKGKFLKHNLFNPKDDNLVTSVIAYSFLDNNGQTTLFVHEDMVNDVTGQQFEDASKGWDAALSAVKEAAEKL